MCFIRCKLLNEKIKIKPETATQMVSRVYTLKTVGESKKETVGVKRNLIQT